MAIEVRLDANSLEHLVRKYAGRPVEFVREILRRDLDTWQLKALQALETTDKPKVRKMSRTAGHGVGKSWLAGMIALYRMCTMEESQTFLTSATYAQLKTRLFPTVIKLIQGSLIPNWFQWNSETISIKGLGCNWIKVQPWSKQNPEALAGLHVTSPALIADESSAIDDIIFESWEGSMQHPNSFLLLLGNPLYRHGELFDSANAKHAAFDYDSISCLDSKFVSKDWIAEMDALSGKESDIYRVRVLGQFPLSETEAFIPEALIRAAIERRVTIQPTDPIVAGLDVARYGSDKSCLCIRQGPRVTLLKYWVKLDTMDLAEEVANLIKHHNVRVCAVDAHGVGGPVYDRLNKLMGNKVLALGDLGRDCSNQFHNKRSMLWGQFRSWLSYGSIPNDKDLTAGSCGLLRQFDAKGREQLESKDLAKMRANVHSPDGGDALAYTFAAKDAVPDPQRYPHGTDTRHDRNTINTQVI